MVEQASSTPPPVRGFIDKEWRAARNAPANILLIGSTASTDTIVCALRSEFCEPIEVWHSGRVLVLPLVEDIGTLILHDLGSMTHDEQRRLCDWLGGNAGKTRVVSTSRLPVFPLVTAGEFAETLYYRLNTLLFQVTEGDSSR